MIQNQSLFWFLILTVILPLDWGLCQDVEYPISVIRIDEEFALNQRKFRLRTVIGRARGHYWIESFEFLQGERLINEWWSGKDITAFSSVIYSKGESKKHAIELKDGSFFIADSNFESWSVFDAHQPKYKIHFKVNAEELPSSEYFSDLPAYLFDSRYQLWLLNSNLPII